MRNIEGFQVQIDNLMVYCRDNNLFLNEKKTKVMVFYRGVLPKFSFYIEKIEIEGVIELKYHGLISTCPLSFSKHILHLPIRLKPEYA